MRTDRPSKSDYSRGPRSLTGFHHLANLQDAIACPPLTGRKTAWDEPSADTRDIQDAHRPLTNSVSPDTLSTSFADELRPLLGLNDFRQSTLCKLPNYHIDVTENYPAYETKFLQDLPASSMLESLKYQVATSPTDQAHSVLANPALPCNSLAAKLSMPWEPSRTTRGMRMRSSSISGLDYHLHANSSTMIQDQFPLGPSLSSLARELEHKAPSLANTLDTLDLESPIPSFQWSKMPYQSDTRNPMYAPCLHDAADNDR